MAEHAKLNSEAQPIARTTPGSHEGQIVGIEHIIAGHLACIGRVENSRVRCSEDVLHIMESIAKAGAGFRSITENIDTTTPAERMMMQMVGAFAKFVWSSPLDTRA
jgi:hypothetical protein